MQVGSVLVHLTYRGTNAPSLRPNPSGGNKDVTTLFKSENPEISRGQIS